MSGTPPFKRLTATNTPSSLKSFPSLFSLVGHVILILAFQIIAFEYVQTLPCDIMILSGPILNGSINLKDTSYTPGFTNSYNGSLRWMADIHPTGCETWACFVIGGLQIVFLSFIFASGPPFRKPFYRNCMLFEYCLYDWRISYFFFHFSKLLVSFDLSIFSFCTFPICSFYLGIHLTNILVTLLIQFDQKMCITFNNF